jgi:hypothetical protein
MFGGELVQSQGCEKLFGKFFKKGLTDFSLTFWQDLQLILED